MKTNIVIEYRVMGQNAVSQSNYRVRENVVSQKEVNDEVYFWHDNKHRPS